MTRTKLQIGISTVLFGLTLLSVSLAPAAPGSSPGPPTPAKPSEQSNKGGEFRGLDRANHVAGEHGKRGRDIAAERGRRGNHPGKPQKGRKSQ
jgi:hypothetical protein